MAKNIKDLKDSVKDESKMKPEMTKLDLPDVKDIPGQENIIPAPMGDLSDVTISSADEEGDELFDEDIDEDIDHENDSNVSAEEKNDLRISVNDKPTTDDANLRNAALDNTDDDGTPLNEGSFKNNISGTDLDIPGATDDDEDEDIGEDDEENNDYSLSDDDTDGHEPEDNF